MKQPGSGGPDSSAAAFIALLVAALAFIYYTGATLPRYVASHFASGGEATGYLTRSMYVRLTLLLVSLPSILLVYLPRRALRDPKARINLPHRDYWLAQERRTQTIDFLSQQCTRFAEMLLVFLCYLHWLIVRANAMHPPRLPSIWFVTGLVIFSGFTVVWVMRLFERFRIDEQ